MYLLLCIHVLQWHLYNYTIVSVFEKLLVIYKLLKPACTAAMNNWNVKELVFLQFDGFTCFQERRG